jgi:hypothetical protein
MLIYFIADIFKIGKHSTQVMHIASLVSITQSMLVESTRDTVGWPGQPIMVDTTKGMASEFLVVMPVFPLFS